MSIALEGQSTLNTVTKWIFPPARILSDVPTILEWHERDGGIEAKINWNQKPDGWVILKEGEPHATNTGPYPFFPELADDMSWYDYTAIPQPEGIGKSLELQLRFIPTEYWNNIGLPRPDSYLIRTDEVHGRFTQYPVSQWIDDYSFRASLIGFGLYLGGALKKRK